MASGARLLKEIQCIQKRTKGIAISPENGFLIANRNNNLEKKDWNPPIGKTLESTRKK